MLTLAQALLDRAEAGIAVSSSELNGIPPVQWDVYWGDLAPLCPSQIAPNQVRQRNALRVELLPDSGPRCAKRSPDGRGLVWLLSGGDPLSYGRCCERACPRRALP